MSSSSSIVEETLRQQRSVWQDVTDRVSRISNHELSPESPRRILLFGIGSSHFAAKLTAFTLLRDKTRERTPIVSCQSLAIGNEVMPQPGDWAFAFTHRASTGPTLQAMDMCAKAGAFTVMVSAQGVEQPDCAKYALYTSPLERCEPHTMGVSGAVCAVTSLLMGTKVMEEWDALRSLGDPDLDKFRDRAGHGPTLLLGEWEGEWLAKEGALKLMEMARLPVRVFGSEEFFHGPRFSLKPEDSIWHVATKKDQRANDIMAKQRVDISGNTPLAWVPALIELQWLSLGTALNLGLNPDGI